MFTPYIELVFPAKTMLQTFRRLLEISTQISFRLGFYILQDSL
jgi:hypothetical protein